MQIKIKGTKIELTEAIKDYVQEKMDMLEKDLGKVTPINCDVEVGMISNHHQKGDIYRAEVNLQLNGELLRVDRTEDDLYKAIDKIKDHLAMMIKKYREKRIDSKRRQEEVTAEDMILAGMAD